MIKKAESETISIIRVTATIMVFLRHYGDWFSADAVVGHIINTGLSTLFFSLLGCLGVPLFFIISGFLYGQKKVEDPLKWYRKRFIVISVPIYIYYIGGSLFLLATGKLGVVDPSNAVRQILHLQGLTGGGIGNLQTAHLWFITYILLCYLITPLLEKVDISIRQLTAFFAGICLLEMVMVSCGIAPGCITHIPGVLSYIYAYFLVQKWDKKISKKMYVSITGLSLLTIGLRLDANYYFGDSNIYDLILVPYTYCILAFWIFFTFYKLCQKYALAREKIYDLLRPIDRVSFEIYIVHYCFIQGVLSLGNLTNSKALNTVVLLVVVAAMAALLKKLSSGIIKFFIR